MTFQHYERLTDSHWSIVETLSMPASRASCAVTPTLPSSAITSTYQLAHPDLATGES